MFGSIITIGAMVGAITSGRIADFIGRKGVCEVVCGTTIFRHRTTRHLISRQGLQNKHEQRV